MVLHSRAGGFASARSGCDEVSGTLRPASSGESDLCMKKWLKRILLAVAVAIVVTLLGSAWSWHMFRGTPDWYQPIAYTIEEGRAAANRLDQKLLDAVSWASEVQAQS